MSAIGSLARRWIAIAAVFIAGVTTAWAASAPIDTDEASREQVYVIPKGTFARRMAGEKLEVLPSEIRLTLGVKDILVLRNDDDVPQLFGPVLIMPGQSFRLPFHKASRYQFVCNLHASGSLEVIVEPMPETSPDRLTRHMSPTGRPEGEYRSAQHEGNPMSPTGRPEGEYRSAQHEDNPMSPTGRPEGEYRSAQHEGSPASAIATSSTVL